MGIAEGTDSLTVGGETDIFEKACVSPVEPEPSGSIKRTNERAMVNGSGVGLQTTTVKPIPAFRARDPRCVFASSRALVKITFWFR